MLLRGRALVIDEITVEGGERIGAAEVRVTSSLQVGQIWNSSAQENVLQALHRLPNVRTVNLQVENHPQGRVGVHIRVEDREPYGIISLMGRGLFWVDGEGFLLGDMEGKPYLPIVTGLRTVKTPSGEQVATEQAQRVIQEFYSLEGRRLSHFTQLDYREYDLELHSQEGWRVLLPIRGLAHQLTRLDRVFSALGDSRWRTLDLRFEGEVMLGP
ncbi:MAG: hypothetical protein A2Z21_08190 [Candidatus Fraserbacteria bacterium RBG_16_55_9]|uniref:POTRA domain-containing protein n=1 Tax=Fraserbacteria sp. (strain RBG_16_55_9) TaxID=1817864 RepID=A0A1F5UNM7_FRAXR|nr:MAG: hypothetical protein A2Z21_08190 [Candidatus Fraserbacteria bacterium RBG_16_55_9]